MFFHKGPNHLRSCNRPQVFLLTIIGISILVCLAFILYTNPEQIAYAPNMVIDGLSIFSSANEMIPQNSWLLTSEIYHSAGMQLFVSWLFRLFGASPLVVKIANWFFYVISIGLVVEVSKYLGLSKSQRLLAAVFVASSGLIICYCATLQYEVIAMSLLIGISLLYWRQNYFWFGIAAGVLIFFRLHFMAVLLPFWIALLIQRDFAKLKRGFAGFLTVVAPLYWIYSSHFQKLGGFQDFPVDHYKKWLCLGAVGWNFPYFEFSPTTACGLDFAIDFPGQFVLLLLRRFGFWVGIYHDIWWIPPFPLLPLPTEVQNCLSLILILLSLGLFCYAFRKAVLSRKIDELICAFLPVFSFLPFLIAGASTRFLVPVIPFVAVLIAKYLGLKCLR